MATALTPQQEQIQEIRQDLATHLSTVTRERPTGKTAYGYSFDDIKAYLGPWLTIHQTNLLIDIANGRNVTTLDRWDQEQLFLWSKEKAGPNPFGATNALEFYRGGLQHDAEHPKGSHYHGDFSIGFSSFNIGKAFTRLFTIKPQSFTLANLTRDLTAGTLAVWTGGGIVQPKIQGEPIASTSTHEASIAGSALEGANTFGTVRAGNPNVPEGFLDKIARLTGGAISSIATGKALAGALRTPTALPAGVEGPPAPLSLSETAGNIASKGILVSAESYGTGQFGQVVVNILGRQLGGALLELLGGNIAGAVKTLTTNPPSGGVTQFGPGPERLVYQGGGGGGGFGVGGFTGQAQSNMLLYVGLGLGVFALAFFLLRKR